LPWQLFYQDFNASTRSIGWHTQVQTTARYAHLAADPVKQAADKIAERLAGALLNGLNNVSPGHEDTAAGQ
jgi:hypothetical protein